MMGLLLLHTSVSLWQVFIVISSWDVHFYRDLQHSRGLLQAGKKQAQGSGHSGSSLTCSRCACKSPCHFLQHFTSFRNLNAFYLAPHLPAPHTTPSSRATAWEVLTSPRFSVFSPFPETRTSLLYYGHSTCDQSGCLGHSWQLTGLSSLF